MDDPRIKLVASRIRDVPDFPKPGIMFKDITPLLADPVAFGACLELFQEQYGDLECDTIVGIESRGFIFGAALAARMGKPFVPVRKPGKLPSSTYAVEYELEYGTDKLEIHTDAIHANQRVLIVDDVLATGGTASACVQLVRKVGANPIGTCFVMELAFLDGRSRCEVDAFSLITY